MEFTLVMSEKMAREVIFSVFAPLQTVSQELKSSRKKLSFQKLDNNLLTIHTCVKKTLAEKFT